MKQVKIDSTVILMLPLLPDIDFKCTYTPNIKLPHDF